MGIFNIILVNQSGTPPSNKFSVRDFTIIAIPLKPPSTRPFISNAEFKAIDINAVPAKINR